MWPMLLALGSDGEEFEQVSKANCLHHARPTAAAKNCGLVAIRTMRCFCNNTINNTINNTTSVNSDRAHAWQWQLSHTCVDS